MLRKTLTILSLIGLLLSVGLWAVSLWEIAYVPRAAGPRFSFANGGMMVSIATLPSHDAPYFQESGLEVGAENVSYSNGQMTLAFKKGLSVGEFTGPRWWGLPSCISGQRSDTLLLPLWVPIAIFGLLLTSIVSPALVRRRKRKKLGLCVKCGYDLRGSKERCPECGTYLDTATNA